jgi:AraC family transcriptional activator of pobA
MSQAEMQDKEIPRYGLYGEAATDEPDFIHIEDIETRSARNDWYIRPHRHHSMYQVLFLQEGEAEVFIDESKVVAKGGVVFTLPAGVVHGFRFNPGTKGKVISIAEQLVNSGLSQAGIDDFQRIIIEPTRIQIDSASAIFGGLVNSVQQMEEEIQRDLPAKRQMLGWQIGTLLITLFREYLKTTGKQETSRTGELGNLFRKLLGEHYADQWKVEEYAAEMNISVSTLNRYCHEWFGQSSKHCIQQRLVKEMKRELVYSSDSLEKIAWSLGFADASYFSRVFKRATGCSPREFRQKNNIMVY